MMDVWEDAEVIYKGIEEAPLSFQTLFNIYDLIKLNSSDYDTHGS